MGFTDELSLSALFMGESTFFILPYGVDIIGMGAEVVIKDP